ncbi:DUF2752 domain-containing protein [Prevotella intermedia]|uniref:DUF2752 domain-containing protein n=1 Tax=Prevotella intermedia TaxID=28131 RepID=UPI0029342B58|nr:DUF2752 domain-containing protein [Prevotella intermedia]
MKRSIKITGLLCLGSILLAIYYLYDPIRSIWLPKCPFKLVTGLQCPGCGLQRALHALLQGRFLDAIHYNYFFVFAGPYIFLFGVRALLPQGELKNEVTKIIEDRRLIWLYIIFFFVWLVVRNILHI